MSKLSEKYIAGFIDADGCIEAQWKAGKYKPLLQISISQKTSQDKVLELIQKDYGGVYRKRTINGSSYSEVTFMGKAAEKLLNRIKKHLVIKRHYANALLSIVEKRQPVKTGGKTREWLKVQRKVPSLPLPNFPPRKWLAGYFDGDGCIWTNYHKKGGYLQINAGITTSNYDTEGIEIIHKAFGGVLKPEARKNGKTALWMLNLPPSKAIKFLSYFIRHSIVKRSQLDFVLACAKMGNFRDGKKIHDTLKHLKAHPHRLSEPGADVSKLVGEVMRIPSGVWRKKHFAQATVGSGIST